MQPIHILQREWMYEGRCTQRHCHVISEGPHDSSYHRFGCSATGSRPSQHNKLKARGKTNDCEAKRSLTRLHMTDSPHGLDEQGGSDRHREHAGENQHQIAANAF